MEGYSNIKWRPRWKVWLPAVLFFIPLILETQLFGTYFTPYVYGIFTLIIGFIYYFRFKLWQAPVIMGMTSIAIWGYFLAARPDEVMETIKLLNIDPGTGLTIWIKTYITMPVWLGILFINFILTYTLGPVLLKALDLERSAIRLFKLAARQVTSETNGFTDRPFNAGKHNTERNQIIGLSSFLEGKKICISEFSNEGIRFIFSMGISPLNPSYRDKLSYVAFSDNGDLNIFISENDYRQYKKQYSFDQLCEMMGHTFLRFADHYINNNEQRIVTELKFV